jgi:hypothetical protein
MSRTPTSWNVRLDRSLVRSLDFARDDMGACVRPARFQAGGPCCRMPVLSFRPVVYPCRKG